MIAPEQTIRTLGVALVLGSLAGAVPAKAQIVAAWDTWSDISTPHDADTVAGGFTATADLNGQDRYNAGFGATDGTYGTSLAGASTASGGLLARERNSANALTIVISNSTGSPYSIDSIHFDWEVRYAAPNYSFRDFAVTYVSGGLGPASTQIGLESNLAEGEHDFDYTLSAALSDTTLDDGESATFVIAFSNYGPGSIDVSGVLDNLAVQGAVDSGPSPGTLIYGK